MADITINSHDILGKCSIIKNYLAVVSSDTSLTPEVKAYIQKAYQANEEMIVYIKQRAENVKNTGFET